MSRPQMTVTVYIPSWPPMDVTSSISTILPAIRNRIPIGAYLKIEECCFKCYLQIQHLSKYLHWHLPHDDGHQPHDGFIETVEEVFEWLTLLPHAANNQTEAHGEHHQTKSVHSVHCTWHWDHLFSRYLMATIDSEYCIIHCHSNMDYSLGILRLELDFKKGVG